MAREPTKYNEWHSRRNNMAMSLCSALYRSKGSVCGCYNGDQDPDAVHFDNCRKMVEAANKALAEVGVPIPPKEVKPA
jgi:hypothetical protein